MAFLAEKCTEILRADKEIGGNGFQSQFRVHIVLFNKKLDLCDQGGFAGDCIFSKVFQYRVITETNGGDMVEQGTKKIHMEPDSVKEAVHFKDGYGEGQRWDLYVSITGKDGSCIAQNSYRDIFALSSGVKGHPERMSHETGMRIYWA